MNTTNLITDYIISGILGLLAFILPYFMIDQGILVQWLNTEIKKETIAAIGIVLVSYSFGIVYNQIADFIEDTFFSLFKIEVIQNAENEVLTKTGFDHHYALQFVVAKSESAYDYISFRRTMIRIVRAVLCLSILIPPLHLIYALIHYFSGTMLAFSLRNLIIIIFCLFFIFITCKLLIKLYKGYYAAISNFALILK